MDINLNKARKLIDELEKTLNETSTQTSSAREVLGQWLSSGEAKLRKKSGTALREVRKRADRFTVALTKLEKDFAKSLDKLSEAVEKKGGEAAKKKGKTAKASKVSPKKAAVKKVPVAKGGSKKAGAVKGAVKKVTPVVKKGGAKAGTSGSES